MLDGGVNVAEPVPQHETFQLFPVRVRARNEVLYRLTGPCCSLGELLSSTRCGCWTARATTCLSKRQVPGLGVLALVGGARAVSPMALLAGGGLVARRRALPPTGPGDRRTFFVFLVLLVGLLALRLGAQLATTRGAAPG